MTVNQFLRWRKGILAGEHKYYPEELIDPLIRTVKRVWIDYEENRSKRRKKQLQLNKL
jgi:hypothetical protein